MPSPKTPRPTRIEARSDELIELGSIIRSEFIVSGTDAFTTGLGSMGFTPIEFLSDTNSIPVRLPICEFPTVLPTKRAFEAPASIRIAAFVLPTIVLFEIVEKLAPRPVTNTPYLLPKRVSTALDPIVLRSIITLSVFSIRNAAPEPKPHTVRFRIDEPPAVL